MYPFNDGSIPFVLHIHLLPAEQQAKEHFPSEMQEGDAQSSPHATNICLGC